MTILPVRTEERAQMVDITREVQRLLREEGLAEGAVVLQSLHTTAALTINENADPDVQHDMVEKVGEMVPHEERYYRHAEGNSDSHVKTSLFGPSLTVIVTRGELLLGTWQGIYFCEWDGPRDRRVAVRFLAAA